MTHQKKQSVEEQIDNFLRYFEIKLNKVGRKKLTHTLINIIKEENQQLLERVKKEIIGEDEPEPENYEHPWFETDLRETRERNERLADQRSKLEQLKKEEE